MHTVNKGKIKMLTLVEIVTFFLLVYGVYLALNPLRKKLEKKLEEKDK